MGLEDGGCKELPSGGVPWAANTVILALAEREDIMVHWKNRVGVSEIARPCRPGQVHGVARDPPERVVQPGGGPDVVLQDACTAHDKSRRRARRRLPLLADPRRLELVARPGTGIGTGSPGVRIEGRIMTRAPRPGGRATQPSTGRSTAACWTTLSAGTRR